MRGSEYGAPRDARSAGRVGAGGREPGQSVCVRYGKAQSSGFAAGRAVLGKDRLLAGFKVIMSAGRGGAAAQLAVAAAFIAAWVVPNSTESAVANGDTRTVVLSDQHTNESGSFTFMVNGVYDQAVLDKLNWFCRDWRINEPTKMDPHLFDIIWEVYREFGVDTADRRSFCIPLATDQRHAAPAVASGGRTFAAHGRQGDRRPFHRRRPRAHPRHRHAHGGGRRRLLPYGRHLGAYRQRLGPLLAADEPGRADPAIPGRKDGIHPGRRTADARLRAGACGDRSPRRSGASGGRRLRNFLLAVRPRRGRRRRRGGGRAGGHDRHGHDRQRARRPRGRRRRRRGAAG